MIVHHPLDWWVQKLEKPFSLARFGDGEFLCIEGKEGRNSHGCSYTPELRNDLLATLEDTRILKGMQRILPSQFRKVRHLLEGEWVDTEIFGDELAVGGMKPFFDKLCTKRLVIVSSKEKDAFPIPHDFIETPLTNAHAAKFEIVTKCLEYKHPAVFLFACGMAAGTFVHELHGKIAGATLIDIGHILDPFVGLKSREYLKDVPQGILNKNLW